MKDKNISIFCDGGARGNPGPAASAFLVKNGNDIIHEESHYIGKATNNVAEYMAVYYSYKWLSDNKTSFDKLISYFLDSKLVVNQLAGNYKINNVNLKKIYLDIKRIENNIDADFKFTYVPREKNTEADFLVNEKLSTKFTLSRPGMN